MIGRVEGTAKGEEHAFGISPGYEDIDWGALGFTREQFEQVISVNDAAWRDELALHDELFTKLKHGLPAALTAAKAGMEKRLTA
jgi:phosphoenolpyruvate carboxykinase (GTP)